MFTLNLPVRPCVIIIRMSSGIMKAWEALRGLDPEDVSKRASVGFDEENESYVLRSFCSDFLIDPYAMTIKSEDPAGGLITGKYGYFSIHSFLWYLLYAKEIPERGRLVRPEDIRGGGQFFRGSHVLPLSELARKYGHDIGGFRERGRALCGGPAGHGDASLTLRPLPRVPATIILWLGDEEFPPRADLLFDSTCELHLPLDIIWSVAMLGVLMML